MPKSPEQAGRKAEYAHRQTDTHYDPMRARRGKTSKAYPHWMCVNCSKTIDEDSDQFKCSCGGYYIRYLNWEQKK
jgi:hypothetical protein